MQAIGSRAAQTSSSCQCRACFSVATTGIARGIRSTATKRRGTLGDAFTFFYSTLLGTAALGDCIGKAKRKREWDRAIADARRELHPDTIGEGPENPASAEVAAHESPVVSRSQNTLNKGNGSPKSPLVPPPTWGSNFSSTALKSRRTVATIPPTSSQILEHRSSPKFTPSSDLSPIASLPSVQRDHAQIVQPWRQRDNEPPLAVKLATLDSHLKQSLKKDPLVRKIRKTFQDTNKCAGVEYFREPALGRNPKTVLHLQMREKMIAKLVSHLILTTKSLTSSSVSEEVSAQMKSMADRIEELEGGNSDLPSYPAHDEEYLENQRGLLHVSLVEIFDSWGPKSNVELCVAKISYNLLVSTAYPDIGTYHILLHGLAKVKQHELAHHVVNSYLWDSRYKSTTTTICLLLEHYTAIKDYKGFLGIIHRCKVTGTEDRTLHAGQDMRLWRRSVKLFRSSKGRLKTKKYAAKRDCVRRGEYVHRRFDRDPKFFTTVIRCYLEFGDWRSAVKQTCAAIHLDFLEGDALAFLVSKLEPNHLDYARKILGVIIEKYRSGNVMERRENEKGLPIFSKSFRWAVRELVARSALTSRSMMVDPESTKAFDLMFETLELGSITAAVRKFSLFIGDLRAGFQDIPSLQGKRTNTFTESVDRILRTITKYNVSLLSESLNARGNELKNITIFENARAHADSSNRHLGITQPVQWSVRNIKRAESLRYIMMLSRKRRRKEISSAIKDKGNRPLEVQGSAKQSEDQAKHRIESAIDEPGGAPGTMCPDCHKYIDGLPTSTRFFGQCLGKASIRGPNIAVAAAG